MMHILKVRWPTCSSSQCVCTTVANTPAGVQKTRASLSTFMSSVSRTNFTLFLLSVHVVIQTCYQHWVLFCLMFQPVCTILYWFLSCGALAEGFLSAQLNKSKIIPAQNASSSCLEASVSYHPVLQHCSWEAPDKAMIQCVKETWVTKHRWLPPVCCKSMLAYRIALLYKVCECLSTTGSYS